MKGTWILCWIALAVYPLDAAGQQVKPIGAVKTGEVKEVELDRQLGSNQSVRWDVESGPGQLIGDTSGPKVTFRSDRPGQVVIVCFIRDPNGERPSTVRFEVTGPALDSALPTTPARSPMPKPSQSAQAPAPATASSLLLEQIEFMIPSGWMGDAMAENGETARLEDGQTTGCHLREPCYRIEYLKPGKLGWAAFAWQRVPDGPMNWGEHPGVDLSDRGFRSIRVWAKGDSAGGGTVRAQFKSGGNVAPKFATTNSASYSVANPTTPLAETYREFCLDLTGKSLRNVVSPLTIVLSRAANPKGAVVMVSDVAFSTAPCRQ